MSTTYTFEDAEVPTPGRGGRVREATPFDDILATVELGQAKQFVCDEKEFDDVRKLLRSAARHAKRGVKIYPTSAGKGKIKIVFVAYQPTARPAKNADNTPADAPADAPAETPAE